MELVENVEEQDAGGDDEDYPEGFGVRPGEFGVGGGGGGGCVGIWKWHANLVYRCCIWDFFAGEKGEQKREECSGNVYEEKKRGLLVSKVCCCALGVMREWQTQ